MAGFVKTKGRSDGGDTIKAKDVGGLEIPAGTSALRPSAAKKGDLRFNTSVDKMEYFDGSSFVQFSKEGNVAITQDSFTGDGSTTAFKSETTVPETEVEHPLLSVIVTS